MEERIIELEMKVGFQEDQLAKLQETVDAQEQLLYKMGKQLDEIRDQLAKSDTTGVMALEDEVPPPHY